jgi:hypothetical protein
MKTTITRNPSGLWYLTINGQTHVSFNLLALLKLIK